MQDEVAKNGNYVKVKEVVDKFIAEVLDKIAAGAKKAASGATGGASISEVVKSDAAGNSPNAGSVKNLIVGIKEIVDLVIKEGNGQADKTKPVNDDKKDIGRLFGAQTAANNGAEDKHVAAASASIGAVIGADILQAIAAADSNATKDGAVKDAKDTAGLALAKGTNTANYEKLGDAAKKDAAIAAEIVLIAIAKDGKFIVKDIGDNKTEAKAAKGVAASAVGKTLSALIIAIRNTVDSGLRTINEALATVKQEDKSAKITSTINKLAKAIGKKIDSNGLTAEADKNESLVAGVFQAITNVKTKLAELETQADNVSDELKGKVTAAKKESDDFLTKVKGQNANLEQNAKAIKAIKKGNADNSKGTKETGDLSTVIDGLLKDANYAVEAAITELTTPAKPAIPGQS
ncbi:VlpD-Vsp chimeric protein (plasmid) [Borrelia hermsii HS1]|uniref:Variable large protein n=1 Tax=Borrelia hermsii HS1 TaxID=1867252 RepID=A0ABN4NY21_BORHE|nr:VlpD-Vsp chimeric protein [Borrelia hermsii HS1]